MYSPLYTAFDGQHSFQSVVATFEDIEVDSWEIVESEGYVQHDVAKLEREPRWDGVKLTTRSEGDYVLLAHAGERTGCTELRIEAVSPDAVEAGQELYETAMYTITSPP